MSKNVVYLFTNPKRVFTPFSEVEVGKLFSSTPDPFVLCRREPEDEPVDADVRKSLVIESQF